MKKTSRKTEGVYAFIDSQNLNLGVLRSMRYRRKEVYKGWKLDMKKFRVYLKKHYGVQKAYLFLGYVEENKKMYASFKKFGYDLIFKPTIKDNNGKPKGNVDAELVLQSAAIDFENYGKAIIVSGDGDFYCLLKFLENKDKLERLLIPNEYSYSSLLRRFKKIKTKTDFVSRSRKKLQLREIKTTR